MGFYKYKWKEDKRNLTPRSNSSLMVSSTLSSTHSLPRFLIRKVMPVSRSVPPLSPPRSELRPLKTRNSSRRVPEESEKSNLSLKRDTVSMKTTSLKSSSDHQKLTNPSVLLLMLRPSSTSSLTVPQSETLSTTLWELS